MKVYFFLVCQPTGYADVAEILAASPAEAVRAVVARFPNCRFNIINVTTL